MILAAACSIMKIRIRNTGDTRCLSAVALFLATVLFAAYPAASSANEALCDAATRHEEQQSRIPSRLLYAIASVESGRWDAETQANFAWPWTVTARGEGKFYPTRTDAIRAVRALISNGVTNIDVGCMQINLGYHPDAFQTLPEAFEPEKNVAYAATFLNDLRKSKRSWSRAVRFYHSSDSARQTHYGRKVYGAGQEIRIRDRRIQVAKLRERAEARQKQRAADAANSTETATEIRKVAGSAWPPHDYRRQRQLEMNARARTFSPK